MTEDNSARQSRQLCFTPQGPARDWIESYTDGTRTMGSDRARRGLDEYVGVMAADLASVPTFSAEEAAIISNAIFAHPPLHPDSVKFLFVVIEDYMTPGGAEGKPDDPRVRALVARIRDLSPGQCWAIYDAARRYWLLESGLTHKERALLVGLTKDIREKILAIPQQCPACGEQTIATADPVVRVCPNCGTRYP